MNSECATAYSDDCFSVLSLARCRLYLEVLEFVSYIYTQRSECSKETVKTVYFVRLIKLNVCFTDLEVSQSNAIYPPKKIIGLFDNMGLQVLICDCEDAKARIPSKTEARTHR